jgi:hypothetical protein
MSTTVVEAAQDKLGLWYPQFVPAVPPLGSAALRAWTGRIQPFPDGKEFAGVMRHFERKERVGVEKHGVLYHPTSCKNSHSFNHNFAQALTTTFELMVLEFEGSRHPRVYGVKPEISRRRYLNHPHLRDDQSLVIEGKPLHALCTYLASDGVLDRDEMELVHVLDYTSMFLAKHLFWVATNFVDHYRLDIPSVRRTANPAALMFGDDIAVFHGTAGPNAAFYTKGAAMETPIQQLTRFMSNGGWKFSGGLWIGDGAPHSVGQMFREIRGKQECHCGSGLPYEKCHRRWDARALGLAR